MIICICNSVNCKTVRAAVQDGARHPKQVLAKQGCKFQCGKCCCSMGEIIAEEMDKVAPQEQLVAAE